MRRYRELSKDEAQVIINKGTEYPESGEYTHFSKAGIYTCKQCGTPLYVSSDKFSSGCGWPSFDDAIDGAVEVCQDRDGRRLEIICKECKGHLGHRFSGEGFTEKNVRDCVNSCSLQFEPETTADGYKRAIFAGGCFWGVEYFFSMLPGVVRCSSGYIGGKVFYPTYQEVSSGLTGHYEAVEVVYDAQAISYEMLVRYFFEIHDPEQEDGQGNDRGSQYRSAIFYFTKEQKQACEKEKALLEKNGYHVATKIVPASHFFPADEYHQRYYEKTGKKPYCHKRVQRVQLEE